MDADVLTQDVGEVEALIGRVYDRATLARFGFAHFGRFAGDHRARFGELPSATLRR